MTASELERALAQLQAGKVVAAATESFFGLLADIESRPAVEALFALKPRGADKGVPTLLPARDAWPSLVAGPIPALAQAFADACWPGGLSIALPSPSRISPRIALEGMLAVRVPGPSAAAELCRRFGRALSATSANLPGEPPATNEHSVQRSFASAIANGDLYVVAGQSPGGAPSTVVRVRGDEYTAARVGAVTEATLDAIAVRARFA